MELYLQSRICFCSNLIRELLFGTILAQLWKVSPVDGTVVPAQRILESAITLLRTRLERKQRGVDSVIICHNHVKVFSQNALYPAGSAQTRPNCLVAERIVLLPERIVLLQERVTKLPLVHCPTPFIRFNVCITTAWRDPGRNLTFQSQNRLTDLTGSFQSPTTTGSTRPQSSCKCRMSGRAVSATRLSFDRHTAP